MKSARLLIASVILLAGPLFAQPFFAFDNGLNDVEGFDEKAALLDEVGYEGPVGLQCYKIKQAAEIHLAKSMEAWKKMKSKPNEWTNLADDPGKAAIIGKLRKFIPATTAPNAKGSSYNFNEYFRKALK